MTKINFTILICLVLFSCTNNKKIEYEGGSLNEIFDAAKKSNRNVFVLLTDSNCGACKDFEKRLNGNDLTLKLLKKEYIFYKADVMEPENRIMAQLVKCPSYPFPYFFDSDGNLLAFGFPNNKDFDISNLNDVEVDKFRFSEFYKLPITITEYKKLISLNMKATLLMNRGTQYYDEALTLFKKSMAIAAYPYNLSKIKTLSDSLHRPIDLQSERLKYSTTLSDKYLYNTSEYSNFVKPEESIIKKNEEYSIIKKTQGLGNLKLNKPYTFKFSIKNISSSGLSIEKISHACDCIKFKWATSIAKSNGILEVNGVFTPYETGTFNKEIYVHTTAKNHPMTSVFITGTVY